MKLLILGLVGLLGMSAQEPTQEERVMVLQRFAELCEARTPAARRDAMTQLVAGGSVTSRVLVEQLEEVALRDPVALRSVLAELRNIFVPRLIQLLQDRSPSRANLAAALLGDLGGPEAVAALRDALPGPTLDRRLTLLNALGATKDPSVRPLLAEAARDATSREVRLAALRALGALGQMEGAPLLIERLDDEDYAIRQASAQALIALGKAVLPLLRNGIEERKDRGRALSVRVASAFPGESAFALIADRVSDSAWPVRLQVVEALARREEPQAKELLRSRLDTELDPLVRSRLVRWCKVGEKSEESR
ncbi:MAG: HEAT repeat domain-containing protein [Planctomycetota bacterium]